MLVPSKDGIVVRKLLVIHYDHVDWKPRLPKEDCLRPLVKNAISKARVRHRLATLKPHDAPSKTNNPVNLVITYRNSHNSGIMTADDHLFRIVINSVRSIEISEFHNVQRYFISRRNPFKSFLIE